MELFFELLLTAMASLLVSFLLAKLFSANDPRREPDRVAGPAAAIAEEEERIIEVDEVRVEGARADVAAEGWVEVEKASAAVAEGELECLAEEEGVTAKVARQLFLGAALEERKEEGEVCEKDCDLTAAAAATETVVEVKPHDLRAESAPREVLDVGLGKERVQDIGAEQYDSGAEAPPSKVLNAGLQKHQVQATEAVEVKHHHLVTSSAPAEVLDAGLEEERAQAIEVKPLELASETVPGEVLDVVFEKQEEQVIEVKHHELAAESAPRAILDVALAEKEELKEQSVEEAIDVREEVQSKEEAKCEVHPVDQQEKLVPKEELVVRKTGDLEVSQEGSSNDKVAVQLPEKEVTLLGMPEDDARADMEFGEWEGIERSEVEKKFGAAASFAASDAGAAALSKLDSDVRLQLQGLLKVAIDGPCYESTQPLTLRPSSRAKWVAWQKLGNMHPEIAMEKYMNLLSETIPGWMGDKTSDTKKHEAGGDSEGPVLTMGAHTSDPHSNQGNEDSTSMDEGPLTRPPNPEKGQSSEMPAE